MAKKLLSAEFAFENHKVVFIGPTVCTYEASINLKVGWELIDERPNKWDSRTPESEGVMGRVFKPRITDAEVVLKRVLKSETKVA